MGDTALGYGDDMQRAVGRGIASSGLHRSDVFLTTKIHCRDDVSKHDWNLKLLGVAYVDLLLMHWPCDFEWKTVSKYLAMEQLVKDGKARMLGVSNFPAALLDAVWAKAVIKPVVNQCGFSV